MALPELKSNITPNNEVVTVHTQDGAEIISQLQNTSNSVDSYVSEGNQVYTTHNVVPQVVTVLKENGQDITSVVEGFWEVVWSVNGQTGDVIIDVVLGEFLPNTVYTKNAVISYDGKIYKAKNTFTSGQSFDASKWDVIYTTTVPEVDAFAANHQYVKNSMIRHNSHLYVAKSNFTSGTSFNPNDWIRVAGDTDQNYTNADQELVDGLRVITSTVSLNKTTEWTDLASFGLSEGTYIMSVKTPSGWGSLWSETYTGILQWYAAATNSSNSCEILMNNSGHADNNNRLYIRVLRHSNSSEVDLTMQYAFAEGGSGDPGSFTFKFRRIL